MSVVLYKVDISHKLEQPIIRSQQLTSSRKKFTLNLTASFKEQKNY